MGSPILITFYTSTYVNSFPSPRSSTDQKLLFPLRFLPIHRYFVFLHFFFSVVVVVVLFFRMFQCVCVVFVLEWRLRALLSIDDYGDNIALLTFPFNLLRSSLLNRSFSVYLYLSLALALTLCYYNSLHSFYASKHFPHIHIHTHAHTSGGVVLA